MIMTRSAAKFWWKKDLPPNVSHLKYERFGGEWEPVTWEEINKERAEKQKAHLYNIRKPEIYIKPCIVWTFFNDTDFFHGWYCYVLTLKKDWSLNFTRYGDYNHLFPKVMNLFPCGVLPLEEYSDEWMKRFAVEYKVGPYGVKKKQGKALAWCKYRYNELQDISLTKESLTI